MEPEIARNQMVSVISSFKFSRYLLVFRTYHLTWNSLRIPPCAPNPFPELVNWVRARHWIRDCEQSHLQCLPTVQNYRARILPEGFQAIDCHERRIMRPGTVSCRFVALSYTWGKSPDDAKLIATKSTIQSYRRKGGLYRSYNSRIGGKCPEWIDKYCQLGLFYYMSLAAAYGCLEDTSSPVPPKDLQSKLFE
jgi:hypothetical protein